MLLGKLRLVAAVRQRKSVADVRREKLLAKLDEQIALATAQAEGKPYEALRQRVRMDDSGQRVSELVPARIKQWWWKTSDGKLLLSIQYGAKALELAKGRNAIEVGAMPEMLDALKNVRASAAAGELDGHIEGASATLRAAFKRKPGRTGARAS